MNKVKMLVMDVDGTLTDGKINMGIHGELFKSFSIKDGMLIGKLSDFGIHSVIITGRTSKIVERRAEELKINSLYQGIDNKIDILEKLIEATGIKNKEVAYIGDDINDLECMGICGFAGCPKDAVKEVKEISHFVSNFNGGDGAVREFIEWLIG